MNDMGEGKTVEWWNAKTEEWRGSSGNGNGHGKRLSIEMRTLPTPKASDGDRGGDAERWKGSKSLNGRRSNLVDAAMHFLPTPTTQPTTGNGHARHLAREVNLLPTPTTSDAKGPSPSHGGTTAEAIRDLVGVATPTPSASTSGPLVGQPRLPWMDEDD